MNRERTSRLLVIALAIAMIFTCDLGAFSAFADTPEKTGVKTVQQDNEDGGGTSSSGAVAQNGTGSSGGSAASGAKAPGGGLKAPAGTEENIDLSRYLTDATEVRFGYRKPGASTDDSVTYTLKDIKNNSGSIPIKDKDGNELNLNDLKSMKVMLAASFKDSAGRDIEITTDQIYYYDLPSVKGVEWQGTDSAWRELKANDGTVLGQYRVNGTRVEIRFNDTFVGLENRFATVTIESEFDTRDIGDDTKIVFDFPGIGKFEGTLKRPIDLEVVKRDSLVKVGSGTDIKDVFENHYRTATHTSTSSSYYNNNFPYIELTEDGQYITQILKVAAHGTNTELVIGDESYSSNNWVYDKTVRIVKVSKDGSEKEIPEGKYTVTQKDGVTYWNLEDNELGTGETIYIAYRTKYDGRKSTWYEASDSTVGEDGKPMDISYAFSHEYDRAFARSKEVVHPRVDYINNYLANYSVAKEYTSVDSSNKTVSWVIYYNLDNAYDLLDGQTIKDLAAAGKLDPVNSSVNVYLVPGGDVDPVKNGNEDTRTSIKATDFGTGKAVQLVRNGKAVSGAGHGDWSGFSGEAFMSSDGYKIPKGTGYGALKIEFTTKYSDPPVTSSGSAAYVVNNAYYNSNHNGERADVGGGGYVPDNFTKTGSWPKDSAGNSDRTKGLIQWISGFRLDNAMKLTYKDRIGNYQRLCLDKSDYPMTIVRQKNNVKTEITRYREGASNDPDAVYYKLEVRNAVDAAYQKPTGGSYRADPSFVITFVNGKGEEVALDTGYYWIKYYTYYDPFAGDSANSPEKSYDVGAYCRNIWYYNHAYLEYGSGSYLERSASVFRSYTYKKGSNSTASPYTGDYEAIPDSLKPQKKDELFWYFSYPALTETTSKVVLKDTMTLDGSCYDSKAKGFYAFNEKMTLEKDRLKVYNGENELTAAQYTLTETETGFEITLEKSKGYDPTEPIKVYYMTKIPYSEDMTSGEEHRYGNEVRIKGYDGSVGNGDSEFPTGVANTFFTWKNGDYQTFKFELLKKEDDYDSSTQYITYTITVNPNGIELNDGKSVELTDTMDDTLEYDVDKDGNFIVPVQVLDEDGNALPSSDYKIDLAKKDSGFGPLRITVPDGRKLVIKYRVRVKPGFSSMGNPQATNTVKLSCEKYEETTASSTVTLKNLDALAGGDPVYITILKKDSAAAAKNEEKLLDGAKFDVTIYKRTKAADGKYELKQQGETIHGVTKNGVYSIRTSYGHVIKVQETEAPEGYFIDDKEPHYYLIERGQEKGKTVTKSDWKDRYSGTFLDGENWDKSVDLISTKSDDDNYKKIIFSDTPNKTSVTATKKWQKKDGSADNSEHADIYFTLYRKASKSEGNPQPVTDADGNKLIAKVPADGRVTWDDLDQYTDMEKTDEWVYSVRETDAEGNDFTPAGYDKDENGLTVTNTREEGRASKDDEFTLVKADAVDADTLLPNAEFTIYSDAECRNAVKTFTTGSDGKAVLGTKEGGTLHDLVPEAGSDATYYIKETKAPSGYSLSNAIHTFTIRAEAASDWNSGHTEYVTTTTYTISGEEIAADGGTRKMTVIDSRNYGSNVTGDSFDVMKIDAADRAKEDPTALEGAEFRIYRDADCTDYTGVEFTAGRKTLGTDDALKDLVPATDGDAVYYIKETKAPDGYGLNDKAYSFKITRTTGSGWNADHSAYVTTVSYRITCDDPDAVATKNAEGVSVPTLRITDEKATHPDDGKPTKPSGENPRTPDEENPTKPRGDNPRSIDTNSSRGKNTRRSGGRLVRAGRAFPRTGDSSDLAVALLILGAAAASAAVIARSRKKESEED